MRKFKDKIRSLEALEAIRDYLPNDHSNRQSLNTYIQQFLSQSTDSVTVLDLGCGDGNSADLFQRITNKVTWHGVDIEDSPEARKRTREHESILTYDGVNLPYSNNTFDLIYCNQVLEHVRSPDALIAEAFRTLKPNGLFVGAVSYLEPYHSYSIFNFTPYGIVRVCSDAGFALEEIRPGPDASLLINRQLLNRSKILRLVWNKNYLHMMLDLIGSLFRLGCRERNFLKVQFAGHLVFLARRPANTPNHDHRA
ncbi:class I SAM-dependent methyltransferase [uncultured Thiodictyon sp.]|uniref:class I SAM-dependent methyltransferase n=1 Tax=uncultured Thiodictyon sp. TaxID=1846217 RepID=UPI0025D91B1F|nr:class I SAM-dependent methyltransferase [uncultured Thiodictyon sp.]